MSTLEGATTLAERDKLINHLQSLIDGNKQFLGGAKLSKDDADKLHALNNYLKETGRGGKKDLEIIHSLLLH
jgi:hypothetical protein